MVSAIHFTVGAETLFISSSVILLVARYLFGPGILAPFRKPGRSSNPQNHLETFGNSSMARNPAYPKTGYEKNSWCAYWPVLTGRRNPRPNGNISNRKTITNQEAGPSLLKMAIQNSKQATTLIDETVDRVLMDSYRRTCGKR